MKTPRLKAQLMTGGGAETASAASSGASTSSATSEHGRFCDLATGLLWLLRGNLARCVQHAVCVWRGRRYRDSEAMLWRAEDAAG